MYKISLIFLVVYLRYYIWDMSETILLPERMVLGVWNFVGDNPPPWVNQFGPNHFDQQFFLTQNFFYLKTFLNQKIFGPKKLFDPKIFWPKKFFDPKIFLTQNFFVPKIFFYPKIFSTQIFLTQQSFSTKKIQFSIALVSVPLSLAQLSPSFLFHPNIKCFEGVLG